MQRQRLKNIKKPEVEAKPKPDRVGGNNDRFLLIGLICLRILNVFLVQTWFVPDEYWQSLEVAHRNVYGYGYLTWEWISGVRSYLHPLFFSFIFFALKLFSVDSRWAIIFAPRVVEALISAVAEYCFFKFIKRHFDPSVAAWTAFSLCSSWFWWYCCTRTLVNSMEAALVCFALYLFPIDSLRSPCSREYVAFAVTAGIATAVRPTSAAVWLPLFLKHFQEVLSKRSSNRTLTWLFMTLLVTSFVLMLSTLVDRYGYGRWLSVHFNFLMFNLVEDLGSFYGSHPWHWYISQGVPVVLASHTPFVLHGVVASFAGRKNFHNFHTIRNLFVAIIGLTIALYSLPSHKEFRFVLSLLPIFMFFCGLSLSSFSRRNQRMAAAVLLLTNIPAMLYFGLAHQSGPGPVMDFLASDAVESAPSIFFLTPCHSTPYYSNLHQNVTMGFITCEPPTGGQDLRSDGNTVFYSDPKEWIRKRWNLENACPPSIPDRLVLFDSLLEELSSLLSSCYRVCFSVFHSHLPEERTGGRMVVLCRK